MSWFVKDGKAHAVSAVTLERCMASFERHEWDYERDNDTITAPFNGLKSVIAIVKTPAFPEMDILRVTLWSTGHDLDEECFPHALEWAEDWNRRTVIGTAKPEMLDEDGGDVRMRVDVSFLCEPGLSDAQLDEALMTGIAHAVGAIETYIEEHVQDNQQDRSPT